MKYIISFILALVAISGFGQIKEPVKWKSRTEKLSDTEYALILEGTIERGWHVYSQFTPDGGPLPLVLKFKDIDGNFSLIGKASESKTKKQFNDIFGVDEIYFENHIVVTQKVKQIAKNKSKINLEIDYQVCKDACINASKSFTFDLNSAKKAEIQTATITKNVDSSAINKQDVVETPKSDTILAQAEEPLQKKSTENSTTSSEPQNKSSQKGLLTIFFIAFFSGFAALLTPCVFPMIPMTVSFFTKQSKTKAQGIKNAVFYGLSIIIIYVLLGIIVSAVFGADALNALSTNVWFNILFFALLVFFASSFLGAFEIMLPNSWANKVDRQADRGGVIGILFMALALAIVSFSCTGPIVGTLLVEAASKGGIAPVVGMLGFSLALALPFMLFAMFPGWLQSLPKSGGWLNTVKVFLGFLELALAFKFLSNADLVLQLHLLEREVFLAIWIAIFGTLTLYLLGKVSLPHDSPLNHISVGRLLIALLSLTFTIYLIPGLWGAPLKLISAFPPPLEYSESPQGFGSQTKNLADLPEGAHIGPNQLVVFEDYEIGLSYAKKVNKPILLDFTGRACVNCRKMENNVWSDPLVLPILQQDVIIISLYVDEAIPLPKDQQFVSKTTGATIETVGDKWTDFMISKYKTNTQPLYVITDLEGNNLNVSVPTISYTPEVATYKNWLLTGISNFKK